MIYAVNTNNLAISEYSGISFGAVYKTYLFTFSESIPASNPFVADEP